MKKLLIGLLFLIPNATSADQGILADVVKLQPASSLPSVCSQGDLRFSSSTSFNYCGTSNNWNSLTGTVNSVGLLEGSATPIYSITGSPVTSTGTLTFSLLSEAKNLIFAGPSSGSNAQPTFRAMVLADLPSISNNGILGNQSGSTGVPSVLNTGTVTESTSSVLTLTSWGNATIGSPTIQVKQATGSQSGYLSSTDWTTFNNKQSTVPIISTPTASTIASWDANKNMSANNHIEGYQSIATAAGTTTLTVSSPRQTVFTGTTTQVAQLPVTSTLVLGQQFLIVNNSTGAVTVTSSGANTIQTMPTSTQLLLTVIATSGTGTASWEWAYQPTQASALGVTVGGTGTVTGPTAFGVIYAANSQSYASTSAGSLGQVLTSNGTSAPTFQPSSGTSPTGSYAQAYDSNPLAEWTTTSGTFADFSLVAGANTITVRKSSGITVTAAASSLPGIVFTPASTAAVYLIIVQCSLTESGAGVGYLQLTDGTTQIASMAGYSSAAIAQTTLSGIYIPGTASPVTVKLQGMTSSGTFVINSGGATGSSAIEWTVVRIF